MPIFQEVRRWRGARKLLTILRDDRKLPGMFGGILIDVAIIVAVTIVAFVWYST